MENISLILSDLDGTLFHNNKSISDYTKKIIKQLQQKGILFGISTSRAYVNAINFLDGITPDVFITNGGGMVFYKENQLYSCQFDENETKTLINSIYEVFGQDVVFSIDNEKHLYSNSREELGDKFWIKTDFKDFNEPAMKICIETLEKEKIIKVASSIGTDQIDFLPFSDIPWYKLSKKDATKEKAIQSLCEKLNISPKTIAAFGDDFNDIGMLKFCGKGIAMQNAIDEVKQISDDICDSNENDGVAKWISNNLLNLPTS